MTDFERGAEAMREAAVARIVHMAHVWNLRPLMERDFIDGIRALPPDARPEEKK